MAKYDSDEKEDKKMLEPYLQMQTEHNERLKKIEEKLGIAKKEEVEEKNKEPNYKRKRH